jgi:hypothetical protein
MTDERNAHEDLARDIGYALWRSPFRVKRDQRIDLCRLIAEAVIEHLKRCGWRFHHLPSSSGLPDSQARDEGKEAARS